jgi:hypothetical protein
VSNVGVLRNNVLNSITNGDTFMDGMRKKKAIGVRFTPRAKDLVDKLAEYLGVTKTSVIEMAIREKAKKEGVS